MSWNAFFLNKTPAEFIHAVDELQPDVIAIQELGQGMADLIAAELQGDYPYMELYPSKIPAGSAVLSRYPFQSTTVPDYNVWSGCNCQMVTIEIGVEVITLINAHPWPPKVAIGGTGDWANLFTLDTTTQDPIFDKIMDRIDRVSMPLLVVGDLNTMPFQPNIQQIKTRLTDAFSVAGHGAGYTFPAQATNHGLPPHPFMRLDYIFHSAAWQTIAAWTAAIPGSDHQYVVADLQLR
jgi:endonuclease/exonuclease/phosphatase (EEP) superfamily protein YafD